MSSLALRIGSALLVSSVLLSLLVPSQKSLPEAVKLGNDGSHCHLDINGHDTEVAVGEGILVGNIWRNCMSYDGHPVIVYSPEPPQVRRIVQATAY